MIIFFAGKMIKKLTIILILFTLVLAEVSLAQVESSSIILNRGKLWQTISFGKTGPSFSNWSRRGIGLDWPGFDPSLIGENIGGSPSHLVSGGMYVGAMAGDSVLSVEEWALYAGSVAEGAAAKYRITEHRRIYPDGENHWLKSDPSGAEEQIRTVWEYNTDYEDEYQIQRMLPIRVTRTSYQWSGSMEDENYIIHEYVIKNIAEELRTVLPADRFIADTLKDFYSLVTYGLHCNSRSWTVLFPSLTPGARNTGFNYNFVDKVVFGRAFDYDESQGSNEVFGLANSMGPLVNGEPTGEYLAPAYAGFRLLYASPNKDGDETKVRQQGWSAASNSIDLSGPFTNIGSREAQYSALEDIRLASNFVESFADQNFMRKSRMWSLMSVGPWDLMPGDSVRIVVAEIVDGADYSMAIDPGSYASNTIDTESRKKFNASSKRAKLTFDNNYNHPDPPAAPEFSVDYNRNSDDVAIILKWGREAENIPDPDDGTDDLEGYIVYRSEYLPVGPWTAIDTIYKGDTDYFDGIEYKYTDSQVDIGQGYYYALTAFDSGKESWTGVQTINNIDPLESSIFANRLQTPFIATLPPKDNLEEALVVPNPFVLGEGFSRPGEQDLIQFVNIPNPCTIRIYTIRGDLVKTIDVGAGEGAIVSWDQVTDFGQFVESGIYVFHIEYDGKSKIGKLAIVR